MIGFVSSIHLAPKQAKQNEILSIDSGKSSMKSPSADLIPAAVRILNEETE
jgi:hypothetical protein